MNNTRVILIVLLLVLIPGVSVYSTYAEETGETDGRRVIGVTPADVGTVESSELLITEISNNDKCSDAEELDDIVFDDGWHKTFTAEVSGTFTSGNDVDDWYLYRSVDGLSYNENDDCIGTTISVSVTGGYGEYLTIDVYKDCSSWPEDVSKSSCSDYEGQPVNEWSGELVHVHNVQPEHEYLIHVNLVAPPEGDEQISYMLAVVEKCITVD